MAHSEPFPTPLRAYSVPDMSYIFPVIYGAQRETWYPLGFFVSLLIAPDFNVAGAPTKSRVGA